MTEELADAAGVKGTAPDECGTCRKALPEGCRTEFKGEASCALTYGVKVDAPTQINGKPWECAQCGKPILADLVWGETAGAFHAVCRRSPPFAPVVTVGVTVASRQTLKPPSP